MPINECRPTGDLGVAMDSTPKKDDLTVKHTMTKLEAMDRMLTESLVICSSLTMDVSGFKLTGARLKAASVLHGCITLLVDKILSSKQILSQIDTICTLLQHEESLNDTTLPSTSATSPKPSSTGRSG